MGVLHLVAMAVVHATLLPATDRSGDAGDRALEHWLLACVLVAAGTTLLWLACCVRIDPGGNRWVPPPRRSGVPPVPDPATGCLPVSLAIVAVTLATLVEVLAVVGPADAVWLTAVTLLVQLVGVVVTSFVVLSAVMPAVLIVTGLRRRDPAEGGGAATGPALVTSGVASYAALVLAALPVAVLGLDLAVGGWATASVLAVVLVAALAVRFGYVRRARPA